MEHQMIWSSFRSLFAVAAAICIVAVPVAAQNQKVEGQLTSPTAQKTPPWAYPVLPPGFQPPPDDGIPKRLAGSNVTFTLTQLRDLFTAYDWFPGDHPTMPEVVAHGRKPDVYACGMCHLPNGQGRPENASLAGLPAAYIAQQMADYKNGMRRSSEPQMGPPSRMLTVGKNTTDEEVKAAAAYFASLQFRPWIRVVESATVPKTRVAGAMLVPAEGGGTEPIGQRIIEMAEALARTELRDPTSGFVAYVPVGSITQGESLVTTGGAGKTIPCGICHGQDLKGLWTVPPLAGRSPSYIVRQLYDMQSGARTGLATQLMREVVAKLTVDDMVSIAAYTASRTP